MCLIISGVISFFSSSNKPTTSFNASCIPFTKSTSSDPFWTSSFVKTTEVVVPSPATLTVDAAACATNLAPRFSSESLSSKLRATVTPSFVRYGCPGWSSIRTGRPFGPRVDPTASASFSTPLNNPSLLNFASLFIIYIKPKIDRRISPPIMYKPIFAVLFVLMNSIKSLNCFFILIDLVLCAFYPPVLLGLSQRKHSTVCNILL